MVYTGYQRFTKLCCLKWGSLICLVCCILLVVCVYYRDARITPMLTVTTTVTMMTTEVDTVAPDPIHEYYSRRRVANGTDNIIFVETSCSFKNPKTLRPGGVSLSPRQACAVYSTATLNPNRSVYIFMTCPLHPDFYYMSSEFIQSLLDVKNVGVVEVGPTPEDWFKRTPLEGFASKLAKSNWPVEHSSDALRMLMLWKYGGTYIDMDVVLLKSLEDLGVNWAGMQDGSQVACGLLNFSPGNRVMNALIKTMMTNYNPVGWTSLGPGLLTTVLKSHCNLTDIVVAGSLRGCEFTIYPRWEFYSVHYSNWRNYFEASGWAKVSKGLTNSHAVHIWNKLSSGLSVAPDSPYGRLAASRCPPVFKLTKNNF